MRLRRVARGHRLTTRLRLIRIRLEGDLDDIVRALLYRPALFGRPYSTALHEVMRGPGPWPVGQRELFAAFTSRLNQCPF